MPADCEKRTYDTRKDRDLVLREGDYVYARTRAMLPGRGRHQERGYLIANHFVKAIKARSRTEVQTDSALSFHEHVNRWKDETGHLSSITKAITNTSYLRIIGMGKKAIPLLLKELQERPDHWLVALNAITGEDPSPEGANFREAVAAWIRWGTERKLC
jgi:hypothetical protein